MRAVRVAQAAPGWTLQFTTQAWGSSIAAEYVARSAPDGYTFLIASPSSISVNPTVNPKLGYSAKDLLPVTQVSSSPLVVAVT